MWKLQKSWKLNHMDETLVPIIVEILNFAAQKPGSSDLSLFLFFFFAPYL